MRETPRLHNKNNKKMKTLAKQTKRNTYIKFNDEAFRTNNHYENREFEKVDFDKLQDSQVAAINDPYGWVELSGNPKTIDEAYSAYIGFLIKIREAHKIENQKFEEKITREQAEAWEDISKMDVIPATVTNIKVLLKHLNAQNWGIWNLPKLSIGYTANQYDCDGKMATTIKLDRPISGVYIENETMFKIGGKSGYLNKYQSV